MEGAYKWRGDGNGLPFIPGLDDWAVYATDSVGEAGEVAHHQAVGGKALAEDVEEHHCFCGDVFRLCEVRRCRQERLESAHDLGRVEGVVIGALDDVFSNAQETLCDRV